MRNSTTRNRQQAKSGQSLRPGQASKKSCKKGLRNSRTKVPTPEAGALLSGLITLPTSTRGICVRVYTFRREYERERERERYGTRIKRYAIHDEEILRVCTREKTHT